jgi:dihydrolipoamide dehydrogenase
VYPLKSPFALYRVLLQDCPRRKKAWDRSNGIERSSPQNDGEERGDCLRFNRGDCLSFQEEQNHPSSGTGLLTSTTLQVGEEQIEASQILLATGSEPIPLPFLPFDEKKILSSTGALRLVAPPKKLLIVGAGVIGLELGSVYRRLGSEVEVVEILDRITPGFDKEVAKTIQQILQKQGFVFHLATRVTGGKVEERGVRLSLERGELEGEVVLIAVGRRPFTQGLGLERIGVQQDKQGRVVVDNNFCTSVPTIYAIGDLIDGPMLAHKASEEGVAVIDYLKGKRVRINYLAIPNVMYTWPEVACVGMTEEESREAQLEIEVGKIPFKAIPRARCSGDEEGFVKVIGERRSGRLIGLHIVGPNASEMIHEGVVAISKGMTLMEIAHASHAHPTCAEGIKEAALQALGQAIHV